MVRLNLIMRWKLLSLNTRGALGIPGEGVKSVDIRKKAKSEGIELA